MTKKNDKALAVVAILGAIAKAFKDSPKTTVAGVAALLLLLEPQAVAFFDGDEATVIDWQIIAGAVAMAVGLFFAKDGDK